jgi:XRE family aerobic/anaerobic benzoate catabolism transcriptional regulator
MPVGEIFSLHGEAYYRRLEGACLEKVLGDGRRYVVALSGGVVQNEEAYALARRRCATVWLKAKPEDHMSRVLAQGDRRPVANRTDAMAELRAILAAREPLYHLADVTVDTSRTGADAAASAIARSLGR